MRRAFDGVARQVDNDFRLEGGNCPAELPLHLCLRAIDDRVLNLAPGLMRHVRRSLATGHADDAMPALDQPGNEEGSDVTGTADDRDEGQDRGQATMSRLAQESSNRLSIMEIIDASFRNRTMENYISGEWQRLAASDTLLLLHPTGEELGRTPLSPAADVGTAVDAAARAFPAWRRVPVTERIQFLFNRHPGRKNTQLARRSISTR